MQITKKEKHLYRILDVAAVIFSLVIFLAPFYFMLLQSLKTSREAGLLTLTWPTGGPHFENFVTVIKTQRYMIVRAFFNSVIITAAVTALQSVGIFNDFVIPSTSCRGAKIPPCS